MRPAAHTTTTAVDAAIIVVICFGMLIVFSIQAVALDFPEAPFTDGGFAFMLGMEIVLAAAALLYLRARGFDIASLVPEPGLKTTLMGLALFFGAWLAGIAATAPFAYGMAEQPIYRMMADSQLTSAPVVAFAMVNGAFEEVFLLGVLVRGLRGFGLSIAVGVPLLVRVLYHLYQGPLGAIWITAFGLVFSLFYVRRPLLWPPVFAHILWDVIPFL